jgi:hypothetical protein
MDAPTGVKGETGRSAAEPSGLLVSDSVLPLEAWTHQLGASWRWKLVKCSCQNMF